MSDEKLKSLFGNNFRQKAAMEESEPIEPSFQSVLNTKINALKLTNNQKHILIDDQDFLELAQQYESLELAIIAELYLVKGCSKQEFEQAISLI